MSRDRDYDQWVRERLSGWPSAKIREFERWLLDEEQFEFVPAVREARRQRSAELDRGPGEVVPVTVAGLAAAEPGEIGSSFNPIKHVTTDGGAVVVRVVQSNVSIRDCIAGVSLNSTTAGG